MIINYIKFFTGKTNLDSKVMKLTISTSELNRIINQLDQAFDKDPWYGKSISTILDSVDPDLAFDPPEPGVHSIAELVTHIITWREFAEKRLAGDTNYLLGQEESFQWQQRFPERSDAWNLLRSQLSDGHQNLLSLLHQNDDSLLDQPVAGKPYNFRYLLNGIIQHDLYHIGQISLIRKMLETKNTPNPGFLKYSYRIFPYQKLSRQK